MPDTSDYEDITDTFITVEDVNTSPFNIPGNEKRIIIKFDYGEPGDIDETLLARDIINVLSPECARELIDKLQQSLDAIDDGYSTPQGRLPH